MALPPAGCNPGWAGGPSETKPLRISLNLSFSNGGDVVSSPSRCEFSLPFRPRVCVQGRVWGYALVLALCWTYKPCGSEQSSGGCVLPGLFQGPGHQTGTKMLSERAQTFLKLFCASVEERKLWRVEDSQGEPSRAVTRGLCLNLLVEIPLVAYRAGREKRSSGSNSLVFNRVHSTIFHPSKVETALSTSLKQTWS